MTTSAIPDNLTERLALIIRSTRGNLRDRFIAIRDAPDAEKPAMYGALVSDAFGDATLTGANRWLQLLRPFLAPGPHIQIPNSPKLG